VSTKTFAERYDAELANDYGNLASRTLAMITRYRDGVIPDVDVDPELAPDFADLCEEVGGLLDAAEVTQALERIWVRVRRLNRYVEERAPWQLAKDPAQAAALDMTLRSLAEGLRVVTVLLHAYMPQTANKLLAALGQVEPQAGVIPEAGVPALAVEGARFGAQPGGATVTKLAQLFPKPE
jgi:methionyl-tRNA synthetase